MLDEPADLPVPLDSNYPEFPDSCPRIQLPFLVDVLQMLVDRPDVLLEQLGDQGLRKPDRLLLEAAFDACSTVVGLIEENLSAGRGRHA